MWDWLFEITGVDALLTRLMTLVLFLIVGMLLLLFVILWPRFLELDIYGKIGSILIAALLLYVLVALLVPEILIAQKFTQEDIYHRVLHYWRIVDGWTRSHQYVGIFLLVSIPFIVWPVHSSEK